MFLFTLLLCGVAFASNDGISAKKNSYKITSNIWIDGKWISSPVIMAYPGQKAAVRLSNKEGQTLKVALIAENTSKKAINIKYDVQYADGNKKMHYQPIMVLTLNQEGVIRIVSDSHHFYEMKVIVN